MGKDSHSPTYAPNLSSSPGAGPSRLSSQQDQRPRTHSLNASTSRDSHAERAQIEQALESKRRRSSIFATVHFGRNGSRKRANTHDSHEVEDGPPHPASPERNKDDKGVAVGNVVDPEETDEGREMEEEIRRLIKEAEAAQVGNKEDIAILKDNRPFTPDLEDRFPPKEYVWDVLFENQRGLYIFGKAYFSSVALLPFDPSPFTLPQEPLEAASSKFLISHPEGNDTVQATEDKSRAPQRRSIKTAYTTETFTVPTPAWEWLTPWMINMRTGTDELGWRYNGVFKKKGWSSKAGPGGWGGWCRRREWVRLRCVKPQVHTDAREMDEDAGDGERQRIKGLKELLTDTEGEEDGCWAMVRELETVSLDREKLQMWERWLDDLDQATRHRLQTIVDSSDSLHTLKRQFIYRSSATRLKQLLAKYDFRLPPASSSGTNMGSPPTRPSISRGYDV